MHRQAWNLCPAPEPVLRAHLSGGVLQAHSPAQRRQSTRAENGPIGSPLRFVPCAERLGKLRQRSREQVLDHANLAFVAGIVTRVASRNGSNASVAPDNPVGVR